MSVGIIKIFIWLLSFNIVQVHPVVKKEEPKCSDCHKELVELPVVHPAMEDCSGCHQAGEQAHPAAGVKTFTLTQPVPELCNTCHEGTKKSPVHAPFESGECLACHTPHNSPNKSLVLNAPVSKLCETCHGLVPAAVKNIHNPVKSGKCTGCHNPHQSDSPKLLKSNMPQLCFTCHEKIQKQSTEKNIHPPFEAECTSCHKAHGSDEEKLTIKKVPELCLDCHGDFPEKYDKMAVQHAPVKAKKSCINCHSPHASGESKYLVKNEKTLCLGCHNKPIKTSNNRTIEDINFLLRSSKVIHAAVEDGCTGCHNPHASDNENLLSGLYSNEIYTVAKAENFGLCFTCHDKELIEKENTTATGFRNGSRNMHFLHINGDKARSCKNCHYVHASVNQHLIKDKTKFGTWDMALNYKSDEKGGSCATGCHREKRYERENAYGNERKKPSAVKIMSAETSVKNAGSDNKTASKIFILNAEDEAQLKADEETRAKADASIKAKDEEETRMKLEAETKKKAEIEAWKKTLSEKKGQMTTAEIEREQALTDSMFNAMTNELKLELKLDSILESKLPKNQITDFKLVKSLELLVNFNKTELVSGKEAELIYVIEFLKNYPERKVEIQGHTDNKGTVELNKEISLKRAEYVRDFIIKKGVNPNQITVVGHGYTRPKDTNDTDEGRAKNRRIEFRLTK